MTTIEKNRLLSEFLGLKPTEINGRYSISKNHIHVNCETEKEAFESFCKSAKFDTDWNWLMQVVEKIEDMQDGEEGDIIRFHFYSVNIYFNTCEIVGANILVDDYPTKIENVYNACAEFVKWYNENK